MKFLCDQCKAKYQIADEKVAGKTVRMKCRKCGHLIEVRADGHRVEREPALRAAARASRRCRRRRPGPATRPRPPGRPGPAAPAPLATSLAAAKPPPPKPDRAGGALAGAFKSTVQRDEEVSAPFDMSDLSPERRVVRRHQRRPGRAHPRRRDAPQGRPRRRHRGVARLAGGPRRVAPGSLRSPSSRPSCARPPRAGALVAPRLPARASAPPPPPRRRRYGSETREPHGTAAGRPARSRAVAPVAPMATAPAARSNVVPITSRLATAERLETPRPRR